MSIPGPSIVQPGSFPDPSRVDPGSVQGLSGVHPKSILGPYRVHSLSFSCKQHSKLHLIFRNIVTVLLTQYTTICELFH